MAPQVGLEPTTLRLTAECSTIELLRNVKDHRFSARCGPRRRCERAVDRKERAGPRQAADVSRVNLAEDLDTPRVVPGAVDEILRFPKTSRALALPTPAYAHLPLVLGPDGKKLGKRDGALPLEALDEACLRATLAFALRALGQEPPEGTSPEMLREARAHFSPARIPREPRQGPAEGRRPG